MSLAVAALAGCTATQPAPPVALPDGVTVALVQLRGDVAARQAQVQVTNGSGEAVIVAEVVVEDPRFEGPATRVVDRVSTIPAGGRVDIRVQLPPVACPTPDDPAPDDPVPEVVLEIGNEEAAASVRTPADDPLGFIAPLHERECRAKALADAATLAFTDFEASQPGEAAALELTITPTGEGRATIVAVEATNLLGFAPESASAEGTVRIDLEIDADSGTEPIVVELPIVPSRCDPHVVQEDKRGTIFDIRLALDGAPGEIELFAGEELRGRILSWVANWCGFGSGS